MSYDEHLISMAGGDGDGIGATEWGTDYWGEVFSEPSEEHARQVAAVGDANVYSRSPMGAWKKVQS